MNKLGTQAPSISFLINQTIAIMRIIRRANDKISNNRLFKNATTTEPPKAILITIITKNLHISWLIGGFTI